MYLIDKKIQEIQPLDSALSMNILNLLDIISTSHTVLLHNVLSRKCVAHDQYRKKTFMSQKGSKVQTACASVPNIYLTAIGNNDCILHTM